MKPSIDLIKKMYVQVIRHNLTQPEEIDQILMAMAAKGLATKTPVASGAKLIDSVRNAERSGFSTVAGFSYGVSHKKPSHRLPDHYLFFESKNV
jgi:cell division septum initiation protein DivIVA